MGVITCWSDLYCPWSYVACVRLHRIRDRLDTETVFFDFRARPDELAQRGPQGEDSRRAEVTALAQLEHEAFSSYRGATWPATSLPGFEAQKWGYSMGQDIGERFDLALRRGFFMHSRDLSLRQHLLEIAKSEGLDSGSLAEALDTGRYRKAVMADYEDSKDYAIEGTPQVVLSDGRSFFNPGITYRWVRGLPIIVDDHPGVYEDLIRAAAADD